MLMLSEDNGGDVEHDDADCDDSYDDDEYEYAAMVGWYNNLSGNMARSWRWPGASRDCEHPSHGGIAARQHGYGDDAAWW